MVKFNQLHSTKLGRYILIGGSVYIFELLIIVIAQSMGANALLAVSLSFWLGLMVSFILQKLVTFQDHRMHKKILIPQFIAVTILVLFNFGFTLLVTRIFVSILPAVLTRTIALGLTTIWNFYLYRTKIFVSNLSVHID